MEKRTHNLILKLARGIEKLEEPVHLLAICSGGITLAKTINSYLRKKDISSKYYEVYTSVVNKKRAIESTNFTKEEYVGTAVIVEDVIWRGQSIVVTKKMLKAMRPKKKIYVAALLDCNKKADFSAFK